MHLVPFEKKDYSLLVSWVQNEEFNFLWGGALYTWPITEAQIEAQQERPEVSSFLAESDGKQIGFIEIVKEKDRQYRLCRILIAAEGSRGQGYGKKMIQLAMEHARLVLGARQVTLGVFEKNRRAINCYRSLGFQVDEREDKSRWFNGEWWPLLRMTQDL